MPEAVRRLGSNVAARNPAMRVGVPVIPATDPLHEDMEAMKGWRPKSAMRSC